MKSLVLRLSMILAVSFLFSAVSMGQMRSNKFGVGVSGSYFLLQSDFKTAKPSFGGGIDLSYSFTEYFSIRSSLGVGFLEANTLNAPPVTASSMQTSLIFGNLYLTADFSPNGEFNPFVFVGGSGVFIDSRAKVSGVSTVLTPSSVRNRMKATVVGGVGFDIFVSEFFSFTVAGEMGLPYSDVIDGYVGGSKKDSYQRISLGIKYYFFDQDFITRMLKALEERYK
jgi:hypothetical protein